MANKSKVQTSKASPYLVFQGSSQFRQRIAAALLSNRPIKIENIRVNDDNFTGIQDFEANFLRLIEKMTDGCRIEINETGTVLKFHPGLIIGGKFSHDCGTSRAMGYFIEYLVPLAIYAKENLQLTLQGITNDDLDISVDMLKHVTLPLLANFGIYNATIKVKQRGCFPKGGGLVELFVPIVRKSLSPVYLTEEGIVKKIRGIAFGTKISPTLLTRTIDGCRKVLNSYLPDVYIHTDHYNGKEGGQSPGYSLCLIAETSTNALLSFEYTAKTRRNSPASSSASSALNNASIPGVLPLLDSSTPTEAITSVSGVELPEDIGSICALQLLEEVFHGGVVDSVHQSLVLFLMVLTSEDVSKIRVGALNQQTLLTLRLIREVFGVMFKITPEKQPLQLPKTDKASNGKKSKSKRASMSDEDDEDEDNDSEEDQEDDEDGGMRFFDDEAEEDNGSEEDDEDDEDDEDSESDDSGKHKKSAKNNKKQVNSNKSRFNLIDDEAEEDNGSDDQDDEDDEASDDDQEEDEDEDEQDGMDEDSQDNEDDEGDMDVEDQEEEQEQEDDVLELERTTYLISCLGIGYTNVNRRVT